MVKKDFSYYVKDITLDFIGSMFLAIGLQVFSVPNEIVAGGVSGISTLINYFTGLPIGTLNLCINIPLLLAGYKYVGKRFFLDTLKVLVISAICIDYIAPIFPVYHGDLLMVAIYGGACVGIGLGLIIMRGSSTGGTDIVVCIIQQIKPHLPFGTIMMSIDFIIVAIAGIVYGNINAVLYALVFIFISGEIINRIVRGFDTRKLVMIISTNPKEICNSISMRLSRGATIIDAKGAYTGSSTNLVLCAVSNNQFPKLKEIVAEHDKNAFVMITEVGEILGQGFKSIG